MYARAVDEAAHQLGELRSDEREGFLLGMAALAAAVAVTTFAPSLALPLFVAGSFSLYRVVRAAVRRCELLETLATDADACVIGEVAARAERAAAMASRRVLAASARRAVANARYAGSGRVLGFAPQLEALAAELDRDDLELDRVHAMLCERLLRDTCSPLYDAELPAAELVAQLNHIRSGFSEARDPRARREQEESS